MTFPAGPPLACGLSNGLPNGSLPTEPGELSVLRTLTSELTQFFLHPYEVFVIVTILQMRKRRLREEKSIAHSCPVK